MCPGNPCESTAASAVRSDPGGVVLQTRVRMESGMDGSLRSASRSGCWSGAQGCRSAGGAHPAAGYCASSGFFNSRVPSRIAPSERDKKRAHGFRKNESTPGKHAQGRPSGPTLNGGSVRRPPGGEALSRVAGGLGCPPSPRAVAARARSPATRNTGRLTPPSPMPRADHARRPTHHTQRTREQGQQRGCQQTCRVSLVG